MTSIFEFLIQNFCSIQVSKPIADSYVQENEVTQDSHSCQDPHWEYGRQSKRSIKSLKLSDLWENKKNTYLEKEGGKNPLATVYRLSNWTNMQKPIIVN